MTDPQTIRIDVRETDGEAQYGGGRRFIWVLQATGPVEDLATSPRTFDTRAEAIADFQRVADILGWKTYVSVDWSPDDV